MFTSKFSRHERFQQHRSLFQHSLFFTLKESSSHTDLRAQRREGSAPVDQTYPTVSAVRGNFLLLPSFSTNLKDLKQLSPSEWTEAPWRCSLEEKRLRQKKLVHCCSCRDMELQLLRAKPRNWVKTRPTVWDSCGANMTEYLQKETENIKRWMKNEEKECKYMLKVGLELLFKVYVAPKSCF